GAYLRLFMVPEYQSDFKAVRILKAYGGVAFLFTICVSFGLSLICRCFEKEDLLNRLFRSS
ncbi:hypothetical protein AAK899_07765, partial [Erysipelotrichaceae bacterium 51-3]